MIDEGANFFALDRDSLIPLNYFFFNLHLDKSFELLKILLKHNDANYIDDPTEPCPAFLYLMIRDPSEEVLQAVIDAGAHLDSHDTEGQNALHLIAKYSTRPGAARLLLDHGMSINQLSNNGGAALHKLLARSDINYDMLRLFLERGAEINQESDKSERPLVKAVAAGQLEAVRILLESNQGRRPAEVDDDDLIGRTALHRTYMRVSRAFRSETLTFVHRCCSIWPCRNHSLPTRKWR